MDILSSSENGSHGSIPEGAKNAIDEITSSIGAKKRGAKPGSIPWNKGAKKGVGETPRREEAAPQAPVTEEQLEFVRESVAKAMEVASNYCTNSVYTSVLAIDTRFEPEAKRFADGVLIPPSEIALVSGAAKAIAVNHPFLVNYAPYAVVIGWAGTYAMRYMSVKKEIRLMRLAIEKLGRPIREEKVSDAGTSQAN